MKKVVLSVALVLILTAIGSMSFGQEKEKISPKFTTGIISGYNSGFGVQANIAVTDLAEMFPFKIQFGIGYTILQPGNAADARRIFINNATNGVPEKKGRTFDYRLDFLLPMSIFKVKNSYLGFGPRYSSFKGNFKFIGGNEDFDVTTNQWGIGAGIENHFKMTEKLNLVLVFGLDYYFKNTLYGHDTSYSRDNNNINPRKDNQNENIPFTYKDADKAITQPTFVPRALIGLSFNL